jgi:hypothetical protein
MKLYNSNNTAHGGAVGFSVALNLTPISVLRLLLLRITITTPKWENEE